MKDKEKSIADKKEFINALDFKTNDIQQDDTVMLQKAINQGAKEHLPVFIPKGIYLVGALFLKIRAISFSKKGLFSREKQRSKHFQRLIHELLE